MPIHHTSRIETWEQINEVLEYCENDVDITKKILLLSKDAIYMRKEIGEENGIDLLSASEAKMSKELFLKLLNEKTGLSKTIIKKQQTVRNNIKIKDLLFDYISFDTPVFKGLLKWFQQLVIEDPLSKNKLKYSIDLNGCIVDYALGGAHGARHARIYEETKDYIIKTSDIVSMYPNLAIRNRYKPEHFDDSFYDLYEDIYNQRRAIPKSDPRNLSKKLMLNIVYGLSNDATSFFRDANYTFKTTCNGQLVLSMLVEKLLNIPESKLLMFNTKNLVL